MALFKYDQWYRGWHNGYRPIKAVRNPAVNAPESEAVILVPAGSGSTLCSEADFRRLIDESSSKGCEMTEGEVRCFEEAMELLDAAGFDAQKGKWA